MGCCILPSTGSILLSRMVLEGTKDFGVAKEKMCVFHVSIPT